MKRTMPHIFKGKQHTGMLGEESKLSYAVRYKPSLITRMCGCFRANTLEDCVDHYTSVLDNVEAKAQQLQFQLWKERQTNGCLQLEVRNLADLHRQVARERDFLVEKYDCGDIKLPAESAKCIYKLRGRCNHDACEICGQSARAARMFYDHAALGAEGNSMDLNPKPSNHDSLTELRDAFMQSSTAKTIQDEPDFGNSIDFSPHHRGSVLLGEYSSGPITTNPLVSRDVSCMTDFLGSQYTQTKGVEETGKVGHDVCVGNSKNHVIEAGVQACTNTREKGTFSDLHPSPDMQLPSSHESMLETDYKQVNQAIFERETVAFPRVSSDYMDTLSMSSIKPDFYGMHTDQLMHSSPIKGDLYDRQYATLPHQSPRRMVQYESAIDRSKEHSSPQKPILKQAESPKKLHNEHSVTFSPACRHKHQCSFSENEGKASAIAERLNKLEQDINKMANKVEKPKDSKLRRETLQLLETHITTLSQSMGELDSKPKERL